MKSIPQPVLDLGDEQESVDARLAAGTYASASEVVRAAIRALDREEAALDGPLQAKVQEAMADKRPAVPVRHVFERLERKHAERMKTIAS